jgi:hypothetical protein
MHESASLARIQPLFLDSKILRSFKMKRSVCPLPPLRSFAQISSLAVLRVIFALTGLIPGCIAALNRRLLFLTE